MFLCFLFGVMEGEPGPEPKLMCVHPRVHIVDTIVTHDAVYVSSWLVMRRISLTPPANATKCSHAVPQLRTEPRI
jgi:hypothetical protein